MTFFVFRFSIRDGKWEFETVNPRLETDNSGEKTNGVLRISFFEKKNDEWVRDWRLGIQVPF